MASDQIFELLHHIQGKLLAEGADDVVVTGMKLRAQQLKFVNNKIAKTGTEGLTNIGIFFVKDKKIVATSFKDVSSLATDAPLGQQALNILKGQADKLIPKLVRFSKPLQPKEDYLGLADGPFEYKKISNLYDKKIANLGAKQQVDFVEAGINAALKEGSKRCSGILETSDTKTFLVTSRKVEASEKCTSAYYSIRALLDGESSGHNTSSERMLNKLNIEETAKFAGQIAALAKNPVQGKSGIYDVVFAPMAWGALLDHVGDATSIFNVEAGMSFFANKLGQQVANTIVNIYDDATLPGSYGAAEYDAEGVPTQKNTLIKNGALKTYLHNTSTARKYKTKTTASAGLISPQPHNVVLEKGKLSKNALFENVKNGIYITNVWYTRFQNYALGDFSTIPRDGIFVIKNGEIKHAIRNLRVKENMVRLLQNVSAIASDAKQMTSWEINVPVVTPHVLIKNVCLTKPTL